MCEATIPRPVPPRVSDDRRCPSNDWREEECHLTASASLLGRRTHPAHPQGALHHQPRVPVLQVFIFSRSPNHRQFQALTDEVNAHYGDLLYFSEVRWLNHGVMLSCMCDLQQEIVIFLRQKNLTGADHFSNPQWLARLALLTDITTHLNDLNVKLQGKNILVTDMYSHITAFVVKLH